MLSTISKAMGAFALIATLLVSSLDAQVAVHSALFEERNVDAGSNYQIEVAVYNSSIEDVEILVIQQDYLFKNNSHHFLDCGRQNHSNCSWIKVPHVRMLLPAKRKTKLFFQVEVPEDAEVGTHHSILGIQTKATAIKRKADNVSMNMNVRYNIQVVTNVNSEEAKKELKLVKTEVKDERLFLTIRNVGEQILKFSIVSPLPEIQTDERGRIYPDMEQTFELDISELNDREYKKLRFLLDSGKDFIQPIYVSFDKGIVPSKAELYALKGEKIEGARRKGRAPYLPRVYAILSWGNNFKSASLSGNVNLFRNLISLRAGSNYREFDNIVSNKMLTHRTGLGLNLKNLRVGYNAYFFENSVARMANASYRLKNFSVNCNYMFSRKILQGSIDQRFWNKWSLRLSGFFDFERQKKNYVASLSIPIL